MLRSYWKYIILLYKIGVKYIVDIYIWMYQISKLFVQILNVVYLYNDWVVLSLIIWLYIMYVFDMNEQINVVSFECDILFVFMFDIFSL